MQDSNNAQQYVRRKHKHSARRKEKRLPSPRQIGVLTITLPVRSVAFSHQNFTSSVSNPRPQRSTPLTICPNHRKPSETLLPIISARLTDPENRGTFHALTICPNHRKPSETLLALSARFTDPENRCTCPPLSNRIFSIPQYCIEFSVTLAHSFRTRKHPNRHRMYRCATHKLHLGKSTTPA